MTWHGISTSVPFLPLIITISGHHRSDQLTFSALNLITELARDAHFDVAPSTFSLLLDCSNNYRLVQQCKRSLLSTRRYKMVLPGRVSTASTESILVLGILPVVKASISTWSYALTKIPLRGSQHAPLTIITPISRPTARHKHKLCRPASLIMKLTVLLSGCCSNVLRSII
jgi:hypothetical protein